MFRETYIVIIQASIFTSNLYSTALQNCENAIYILFTFDDIINAIASQLQWM